MRAVGIILAGGKSERLGELTRNRATSALPVGSCYRAIDFPLSNMTNSGISKVAIITQYNSRSLHDHLSSPKWWDLGSKQGGMFVFSPYQSGENSMWFRGTADAIYQNLTFLKRSNEPYVIISSGDCVYKMNYNDLIAYHEQKNADITIAYRQVPDNDDIRQYGVMELDAANRLTDLEEKPLEPQSDLASIGVYVISRPLLIELVETIVSEGRYDLVRDLLSRYRKRLRIYGYRFDGYWRNLGSIHSYFDCNMDFLRRDIRNDFTVQHPYIKTKPKDEPPAKFNNMAHVTNCLVGSGAILNGNANRSIIFRRVYTGEHSTISNAILMEGTYIGNNCVVEHAILDKDVILHNGARIVGTPESPAVITKGHEVKA
ncbi:MAG: glucose-1-phosphate adenylyltransferase subunit GlgD [Clostridiales bacterium]|jgi:glucose-1-phosphate adenylyltransferase|nr:glucose-1-phosphate adenylyltransferase subunit GlgD [Clostridiales bacterium]